MFFVDALKKNKVTRNSLQRLASGRWSKNCHIIYLSALLNDQFDDYERVINLMVDRPKMIARCLQGRGELHAKAGRLDLAVNDYKASLAIRPQNSIYRRLIELQRRSGAIWDRVEILREYLAIYPDQASFWAELGHLSFKMNRFKDAVDSFEKALKLKPNDLSWLYWLAHAKERMEEQIDPVGLLYDEVLEHEKPRQARLGKGFLHQKKNRWLEASQAYAAQLEQDPDNRFLAYHLGRTRARLFNWAGAIEAYRLALSSEPKADKTAQKAMQKSSTDKSIITLTDEERAECCYNLALALERLNNFEEAIPAYKQAIAEHPKPRGDFFYRLGCTLNSAGRDQEACEAFLQSTEASKLTLNINGLKVNPNDLARSGEDKTDPNGHCECGQIFELRADLANAAHHYKMAIDRFPNHNAEIYYLLGLVLYRLENYKDACRAFRLSRRIYRHPSLAALPKKCSSHALNMFSYVEDMENLPVRDKVVLYESFHGRVMGCNPYAIFKYLLDNPDYADYLHVWALNDKKSMPQEYYGRDNVIFVPFKSSLYYRYLATAKYLINNNTFQYEFIRRHEQKYLNTWHGTPLKILGKDAVADFLIHGNIARNFLQASHILHPCTFTREKLLTMSEVDELVSGQVAETGYPRVDIILKATEKEKNAWRARLKLDADKPVILYAPTWRGAPRARPNDAKIDIERCLADLKTLAKLPAQIVFRGHHLIENSIDDQLLPVIVGSSKYLDASEILTITDILITDYSSIFFDFLPTRKPIIHYAYDQAEYQNQRGGEGFYLPLEDLPGTICRNMDDLRSVIQKLLTEPYQAGEKHLEAIKTFCPYEDGHSTERAVDFLFHDCQDQVIKPEPDLRSSVLIRAGHFLPNGITSSFLNLTSKIDCDKIKLALFVDRDEIAKYDDRIQRFHHFPRNKAQLVFKVGGMLRSMEEKMVEDLTAANYELSAFPEIQNIKANIYKRELLRLIGHTSFDALVNFDGYGEYGGALFASQPYTNSAIKLIYLHNDMYSEYKVKYPQLELLFAGCYKHYNQLISVSQGVMESNRKCLASKYNIPENLFIYANNIMNDIKIINKAQEPLEGELNTFIKGRTSFITLGRLSPEKDHEKLIRAFASINAEYPDTCLLIVGYGLLEAKLLKLINRLGLDGAVKLTGYKENPYPLLKAADCFVLSSNHEGQGLVLLEAMILKRPIITTDLPPTRSVMELDGGGFGLLVENSQEGLAAGMNTFLSEKLPTKYFDIARYNQEALRKFNTCLNLK